jgi:hypothetical protein
MKLRGPELASGVRTHWGWWLAVAATPILVFGSIAPFVSGLTLGNDYPQFHISHQMELQFALLSGVFPLYVPGFAGGHSAAALTLGQIFHPLSHLAARLPGYWSGLALEWNTLLRLALLAAAHAAVLAMLRRWKLRAWAAFAVSAAVVYNLRALDLFRYGAALEAWTGLAFLITAVAAYQAHPHRRLTPAWPASSRCCCLTSPPASIRRLDSRCPLSCASTLSRPHGARWV